MSTRKQNINWAIRILIFILFILSAVSKMYPIWAFEKQLVDLNFFTWCQAPYIARFIIALELAIGIAFLQKHYVKKLIIPITILLLVAFCVHLCIQMVQFGPMNGNCGCFGQLIPMTPLEAFIKNIITIALLTYLYRNTQENENSRLLYPSLIFIGSLAVMLISFKIPPCIEEAKPLPVFIQRDSIQLTNVSHGEEAVVAIDGKVREDIRIDTSLLKKQLKKQVAKTHSKFATYITFGDKKVNLDEGKKIVCMFAAGCDHCRATAKAICKLSLNDFNFPKVYILFMDEETFLINEFFQETCIYPYQIVDIPEFWNTLGTGKSTPGVFLLNNGRIIKSYEGITDNKFDAEEFKNIVSSIK